MPTKKSQEGKLIGRVVHYFDEIGVAVIKLAGPLRTTDTVRFIGGQNTDFEQEVVSMEQEHKKIKRAKKGDEIGLKARERVREGYKVYKL